MKAMNNNRFQFLLRQSQDRCLDEKGISLVETVIALGLLGFIGVVFMTGLYVISNNTGVYQELVTASALAQSQMEEIKAASYDPSGQYPISVPASPGYNISISLDPPYVDGKQNIRVVVKWGGNGVHQLKTIKSTR